MSLRRHRSRRPAAERSEITSAVTAFLLTGLSEGLQALLTSYGVDTPGAKGVFYGVCLMLVIIVLPNGIWPPIARLLHLERRGPEG